MSMDIRLRIPDSVIQALRAPEDHVEQELLRELAVSLHARGFMSFGKAREWGKLQTGSTEER